MGVVKDIVHHGIARAAVLNVDVPASVHGLHNRVVDDHISRRPRRAIDLIQRYSAGVVVVQQVILETGVLNAIAVNARPASKPVIVDHVALDQSTGNDPIPALEDIAIHVYSVGAVAPNHIVANDRAITAVGDIDTVFNLGAGGGVVLDEQVIAKPGEDAPAVIVIKRVAADRDMVVRHRADSSPRHAVDGKSFNRYVICPFQIDPVGRDSIAARDCGPRFGMKHDRAGSCAVCPEVETDVVSRADDDRVSSMHRVRCFLKRLPRRYRRTCLGVAAGIGDIKCR